MARGVDDDFGGRATCFHPRHREEQSDAAIQSRKRGPGSLRCARKDGVTVGVG